MPPPLILLQDISLTFGVMPLLSGATLALDRKNWYVLEVGPRVRIRLAAAQSQAIRSTMYFGPRCWSGRPGINRGGLADDCRFRIGGAGTRSGAFVSESKSRTSRVVDRGGRGYSGMGAIVAIPTLRP